MSSIHLKDIVVEDFINYKKPSMFLISSICDWKCCTEADMPISICYNNPLVNIETKEFDCQKIIENYYHNDIIHALVIGGLEPFCQFDEVLDLIDQFRVYQKENNLPEDDIVIYTGYNKEEIKEELILLSKYNNIIIKYGRYVPDSKCIFDDILGITLVSDNQYAERLCTGDDCIYENKCDSISS